ncbi:unnamed protein product [Discosporangium mesarthrocarpum]
MRIPNKLLTYAGTKDKRAVTSQWCTVKRRGKEELQAFNRPLGCHAGPIVLLANFSYVERPLSLGDLSGNRFSVVLRNIRPSLPPTVAKRGSQARAEPQARSLGDPAPTPGEEEDRAEDNDCKGKELDESNNANGNDTGEGESSKAEADVKLKKTIAERCSVVREQGFINYFGLQRFGTGGAATSETGLAVMKEDWKKAVELIMRPRMGENEATHEAKVFYLKNPSDPQGVLNRLPFFMDAERTMMQALLKGGPNPHLAALLAIPKNLQMMYLHAFQSLLWNLAATHRVKTYGVSKVVAGDLIIPKGISSEDPLDLVAEPALECEEGGAASMEEVLAVAEEEKEEEEGRAAKRVRQSSSNLPAAHVVTEEEARNRTFQVVDVVLPMPGHGVTYPANTVKDCFKQALEDRGLSFDSFHASSNASFRLRGAYRRLIQVPMDMTWALKRYSDNTLHIVNTDIDTLLDEDERRVAAEAGAAVAGDDKEKDHAKAESTPAPMEVEPVTSAGTEAEADKRKSDEDQGNLQALCLEFTLPSAAYATMCLREITKEDSSSSYHTLLNNLPAGAHSGQIMGLDVAPKVEGPSETKTKVIKIGASIK